MSFFETIGLGLLTNFLSDLLKKKLKFKMNRTDVDKIADRLNLVLSLMNEGRDGKFTVAQFSKILELKKGVFLYPRDYFYPISPDESKDMFTKNTRMIHYYNGSWLDEKDQMIFKFKY